MRLSWPRLIGIASGIFGAAVAVGAAIQVSMAGSFAVLTLGDSPGAYSAVCGGAFFVLAIPLFTGREWARRALLLITYCTIAALAIFLCHTLFQRSYSASVNPTLRFAIGICALIDFLTPPAFLLGVLHHADVRRAFQSQVTSNQVMQPTASSRTTLLSDD